MRSMADAVMVGVGTVRKDDPAYGPACQVQGPVKDVVDTGFSIPLNAKVFRSGSGGLLS